MSQNRVNVGVGGRFHSDRLMESLKRGETLAHLFTTYPKSRFSLVDKNLITSSLLPEILYRGCKKLGYERKGEQLKMQRFGSWLAGQLSSAPPDIAIIWSSFAKESFEALRGKSHRIVMRDSTHIDHQMEVLQKENAKLGIPFEIDPVCLSRERYEYQNSDEIWVLSKFAAKTFEIRGFPKEKIKSFSLGVDTKLFAPPAEKKMTLPLRLIYFGTLSVRKGVHYLLEATSKLPPDQFQTTLVGPIEKDFIPTFKKYSHCTWFPPEPHIRLSKRVRQHDIYLFPSLEDGFPNTLVQAMASGLVPMTTSENGVSELIQNEVDGFLMPKVDSELWATKLLSLANQKEKLLAMGKESVRLATKYSWENYYRQILQRTNDILNASQPQRYAS